jgi:hypothetical protein
MIIPKKNGGLFRPAVVLDSNIETKHYLNFTRAVSPKVRGAPR